MTGASFLFLSTQSRYGLGTVNLFQAPVSIRRIGLSRRGWRIAGFYALGFLHRKAKRKPPFNVQNFSLHRGRGQDRFDGVVAKSTPWLILSIRVPSGSAGNILRRVSLLFLLTWSSYHRPRTASGAYVVALSRRKRCAGWRECRWPRVQSCRAVPLQALQI